MPPTSAGSRSTGCPPWRSTTARSSPVSVLCPTPPGGMLPPGSQEAIEDNPKGRSMVFPRSIAAGLLLVGLASGAHAAPVVYNFTATLAQPIDGSNQVSGSFTLEDAYPSTSNNSSVVFEPEPNKYPLTLNFAGHSITLDNLTMPFGEGYFQFTYGDIINLGG